MSRAVPPPPMSLPLVARAVIVLCVAVEVLLQAGDLGLWGVTRLRATVIDFGGFWPGLLEGWQENYPLQRYAMFLTYAFLHGGLLHLAMNMYTLWVLAGPIADRIGPGGLAQLYTGSAIGGAAGYAVWAQVPLPMVGASGALFGLAGAITVWVWRDRRNREGLIELARILAYLVGINVAMYWVLDGHLAWQTHLGGFLVGALFGWVLDRPAMPRRRGPRA